MSPRDRWGAVSGWTESIEDAEWRSQVSTRETPEDLLLARESDDEDAMAERDNAALRELAAEELSALLERIPTREALALMLHLGLLGHAPHYQTEIAMILGVKSQQVVSYMVRRARARILYLATRPALDAEALQGALTPAQIDTVRLVWECASFRDAWRRRRPDAPSDRGHAWERTQDRRIKRAFMFALAKIERRAELAEQARALRHVLAHLGSLSHHTGKGSWAR